MRRFRQKFGLRFTPREDDYCKRLADGYAINGRYKRIYHYHIRKTGGTSLNQTFLASTGLPASELYAGLSRAPHFRIVVDDKIFVGWNRRLIEQGDYFYAFSHLPWHQVRIPDRTFTITAIRDPIDRLLSHYYMLMDYREAGADRIDLREEMKWLGNSFLDFVTNIPREHLLRQLYMFSERYAVTEAFDKIIACSHILFTSTMAEDVNDLSKELKLNMTPLHTRRSTKNQPVDQAGMDLAHTLLRPEMLLYENLKKYRLASNNRQL